MKNIHVIPTDKPSRLLLSKRNNLQFLKDNASLNSNNHFEGTYQNIYITNDEEIKDYNWYISSDGKLLQFTGRNVLGDKFIAPKVITTTDQDLIKDGVQAIDDEFLKWFVKNSNCEKVEVELVEDLYGLIVKKENLSNEKPAFFSYKIIIPKEEPKQETLEEAAEKYLLSSVERNQYGDELSFVDGAKWQQEQFGKSEFLQKLRGTLSDAEARRLIFEQFKKK